ncbi:spore coat protein [Fictibacillus gelatini]|uniref:spore coat protein n=1 Tax=Fictibacillus gelatini TaxID=225985 RepID=UPI0003F64D27|nr:spore coat protein [Fictibacillus gelatini]
MEHSNSDKSVQTIERKWTALDPSSRHPLSVQNLANRKNLNERIQLKDAENIHFITISEETIIGLNTAFQAALVFMAEVAIKNVRMRDAVIQDLLSSIQIEPPSIPKVDVENSKNITIVLDSTTAILSAQIALQILNAFLETINGYKLLD